MVHCDIQKKVQRWYHKMLFQNQCNLFTTCIVVDAPYPLPCILGFFSTVKNCITQQHPHPTISSLLVFLLLPCIAVLLFNLYLFPILVLPLAAPKTAGTLQQSVSILLLVLSLSVLTFIARLDELPRHTPSRQQVAINSVEMQTECPDPNRRKLMQTVLASTMLILLPRNASAKTGESAKLSIFGVEGLSSPFTADLKSQGEPLYKNLNEEEMSRYTRAITDGRTSLSKIPEFVSEKSWEDVKSAIRQRVADLRTAQRRLMAAISEQNIRKKAEKIYDNFKKSIEEIDLAAKQKNGDKTLQAQKQAMKYLQEWASVAGLNI